MMTKKKTPLSDILLSVPMASELWSIPEKILSETKIKTYLQNGKFYPWESVKLGKNWVVTREGMKRVFGSMPERNIEG